MLILDNLVLNINKKKDIEKEKEYDKGSSFVVRESMLDEFLDK